MIARLKGTIIEKQPPHILVDVGGLGYEMQAPMTSFYPMPAVGEAVTLHTHLAISENAHQLFAFYTQDERKLFRLLIKVSGVGPKMALAILSGMPTEEFVHCVRADNVTALVKVPGVGKKTAERLIIEIKDRLKDWNTAAAEGVSTPDIIVNQSASSITADAESALVALGYRPTEAAKVIASIHKQASPDNSEALIRLALKSLAG